ncbi:unnamed protein product [Moneuplotes crassus]|uniref:Uncharacterized protein n=1 Tax=Euplotes crassus TaxID=5936 RepID=A0AAD2DAW0_EUPCR|nr:unnamed protein product [Moneuplotes crassus]
MIEEVIAFQRNRKNHRLSKKMLNPGILVNPRRKKDKIIKRNGQTRLANDFYKKLNKKKKEEPIARNKLLSKVHYVKQQRARSQPLIGSHESTKVSSSKKQLTDLQKSSVAYKNQLAKKNQQTQNLIRNMSNIRKERIIRANKAFDAITCFSKGNLRKSQISKNLHKTLNTKSGPEVLISEGRELSEDSQGIVDILEGDLDKLKVLSYLQNWLKRGNTGKKRGPGRDFGDIFGGDKDLWALFRSAYGQNSLPKHGAGGSQGSMFGEIKGINFGSQFQFLDTYKKNEGVKSKVTNGLQDECDSSKMNSHKEIPLSFILKDLIQKKDEYDKEKLPGRNNMNENFPKIPKIQKKRKANLSLPKQIELDPSLDKDIRVLQLKQKREFSKTIKNLDLSRKIAHTYKNIPELASEDPIVASVKHQLEEEKTSYFDPEDPSVYINFINGKVSRDLTHNNRSTQKKDRKKNMKEYLDFLHNQFYMCDQYEALKPPRSDLGSHSGTSSLQKFRPLSNVSSTKASTSQNFRKRMVSGFATNHSQRVLNRNGASGYLIKRNFLKPQNLREFDRL